MMIQNHIKKFLVPLMSGVQPIGCYSNDHNGLLILSIGLSSSLAFYLQVTLLTRSAVALGLCFQRGLKTIYRSRVSTLFALIRLLSIFCARWWCGLCLYIMYFGICLF